MLNGGRILSHTLTASLNAVNDEILAKTDLFRSDSGFDRSDHERHSRHDMKKTMDLNHIEEQHPRNEKGQIVRRS